MITYIRQPRRDGVYAESGMRGWRGRAPGDGDFEGATPGFLGRRSDHGRRHGRFFYGSSRTSRAAPRLRERLLTRHHAVERWGIPQVIGHGWSIWFKEGGARRWEEDTSGAVTTSCALVHTGGERLALAVLSDESPGTWGVRGDRGRTSACLQRHRPRMGGRRPS